MRGRPFWYLLVMVMGILVVSGGVVVHLISLHAVARVMCSKVRLRAFLANFPLVFRVFEDMEHMKNVLCGLSKDTFAVLPSSDWAKDTSKVRLYPGDYVLVLAFVTYQKSLQKWIRVRVLKDRAQRGSKWKLLWASLVTPSQVLTGYVTADCLGLPEEYEVAEKLKKVFAKSGYNFWKFPPYIRWALVRWAKDSVENGNFSEGRFMIMGKHVESFEWQAVQRLGVQCPLLPDHLKKVSDSICQKEERFQKIPIERGVHLYHYHLFSSYEVFIYWVWDHYEYENDQYSERKAPVYVRLSRKSSSLREILETSCKKFVTVRNPQS